ncbi:hypothetical protein [Saccharothrix saharensis]|nr:hypothetical protein [Saccharothrix saharensis]
MPRPYPHAHDDCDSCGQFDADMAVHHRHPNGADQRLCQRCAGPVLTRLVLTGHTLTVRALDHDDRIDQGTPGTGHDAVDGHPDPTTLSHERIEPRHVEGVLWTVELAEQALRGARPAGSTFLRVLIDQGGTATAARLRELTGQHNLHHMTLTVNTSARRVLGGRQDGSGERLRVAIPRPDPNAPRSQTVHDYTLPEDLVPILDAALRRIGR